MRADENGMRPLFQGMDVSGAATSYPVPMSMHDFLNLQKPILS